MSFQVFISAKYNFVFNLAYRNRRNLLKPAVKTVTSMLERTPGVKIQMR